MSLNNFRQIHLPYCLKRLENGKYVVLNREYQPLGFRAEKWDYLSNPATYENYPIAFDFPWLNEDMARILSIDGKPDLDQIWLYNDGTVPDWSPRISMVYFTKLAILMNWNVNPNQHELDRDQNTIDAITMLKAMETITENVDPLKSWGEYGEIKIN